MAKPEKRTSAAGAATPEGIAEALPAIYQRLWRYCLSLSGNRDAAGDLAQAVCLRAMERAHQFQPGTELDRWVFRIAQRYWIDEMRKQTVRVGGGLAPVEEIDLPDKNPGPEANLFARQTLSQVMALPEAQRTTVMLVYVEGYSYREAAEILDIPVGTVMSRLSGARGKLAAALNDDLKQDDNSA